MTDPKGQPSSGHFDDFGLLSPGTSQGSASSPGTPAQPPVRNSDPQTVFIQQLSDENVRLNRENTMLKELLARHRIDLAPRDTHIPKPKEGNTIILKEQIVNLNPSTAWKREPDHKNSYYLENAHAPAGHSEDPQPNPAPPNDPPPQHTHYAPELEEADWEFLDRQGYDPTTLEEESARMIEIMLEEAKSKNRFHIDRTKVLGKGGFGCVYEGFDTKLGRPIAVKESFTMAQQQELLDEFEILTTLRHENIVQVFDMNYDPDQCICQIFMQKLSAGSVDSIIKTSRGYPFRLHENVIRLYLYAALNGLAYMHENGVRHGDIKPGNILVSEDGVVKLSDFGTSRVVDATKKDNKGVSYTVPFLSPEAAHGHYGTASDIWALGCTVLEMATAQSPWHHLANAIKGRPDSLCWHIGSLNQTTSPELHPRIPGHLSPGLASILRLMFSFTPEDRTSARSIAALPYFTEIGFAKAKKAGEVESHETWVAEGEAVQAELEAQRQVTIQESSRRGNHQGDQFEMPAGQTSCGGSMYGNTNSVKAGLLDSDAEGAYDDRNRDMEVQIDVDTTQSQQ